MRSFPFFITFLLADIAVLQAQKIKFEGYEAEAISVSIAKVKIMGKEALQVVKDSIIKAVDEPTFIRLNNVRFTNGTIEVKVLSRLLPDAPGYARGFIGIAFRINDSNTKYESIYLCPINARINDQVRRNHSIQYYSYPNYKFDTLRKIAPEKYESYADMEMNKWIDVTIIVKDSTAQLFVNKNEQPSLIVNDLKLGANVS